tara:strand:- start:4144 stop:5019 length:876 start_codon:yes stop_codon:yes gene_type:complete
MLPDNFNFAMMPTGSGDFKLSEIGMLSSTIEDIDYAFMSWMKVDLRLSTTTNEGYTTVPVLWQVPERSYQIKHARDLRDDAGALKLPIIGVERASITKDPAKRGSFQANLYSDKFNGRAGRFVIAKRIVQDKTRNFAVAAGTRTNNDGTLQKHFPRVNRKVVIQTVSIPIPVYVTIDYKIVLKSEYQQQMNDMLAPFIARTGQTNAFTLKRKGHIYESFIQSSFVHSSNVANLGEDMRMYTSEVNIQVLGYLIGTGDSDDRPIVRLEENTVEFHWPSESVVPKGNFNLFDL